MNKNNIIGILVIICLLLLFTKSCNKNQITTKTVTNHTLSIDTVTEVKYITKIKKVPVIYNTHSTDTIKTIVTKINDRIKLYIKEFKRNDSLVDLTLYDSTYSTGTIKHQGFKLDVNIKQKIITKIIDNTITIKKNVTSIGIGVNQSFFPYSFQPSIFLHTKSGILIQVSKDIQSKQFNINIGKTLIKW